MIFISFLPLISIISFVMIIIKKREKKILKNEDADLIIKKYFKSYVSNITDLKVEWLNYEKTKINIEAKNSSSIHNMIIIENYLFGIGKVFEKVLLSKQVQDIEMITIRIKDIYVDDFGNPVLQDSIYLKLGMENIKKINWSGFSALDLPKLAEEFFLHPNIPKE